MLLEEQQNENTDRDETILALSVKKPAEFSVLVDRYQEAFLRKAQSILHDKEASEDVVQETFTKIYLNANRFVEVEGASFKSWAYTILTNTALSSYRKRKREWATSVRLDSEVYESMPDIDTRFKENETADYVASVLTHVPKRFQKILQQYFHEGKSQKEIAEGEGTTVGAIKTRMYRAKEEFRKGSQFVN